MKRYTGTKTLEASPMTCQEYITYRGWTLPLDEDGTREGYLVKYENGEDIVWSPADVFERTYTEILDSTD